MTAFPRFFANLSRLRLDNERNFRQLQDKWALDRLLMAAQDRQMKQPAIYREEK